MNYSENIARAEFFDRIAQEWNDQRYIAGEQDKVIRLFREFQIHPQGVVVDIGCGTGIVCSLLQGSVKQIIAVDCSIEMLRVFCQLHCGQNSYPLLCFAEELPLRDSLADWVIAYSSFPHIGDKEKSLSEISRVLRPGGKLLIFHSDSRAKINAFHSQLPPPLCYDKLPSTEELSEMSRAVSLYPKVSKESEDFYFFLAQKTCA